MKKLKYIVIFIAAAALLSGCEKSNQDSVTDELPPETTSSAVSETAEKETEMTFPEMEETPSISGEYVFDDAKVLSEKAKADIFNETLYISNTYKVNCAVVTTAKLDGKSVSDYAEEYYKKLYGSENGILFLINNDTGDDYILRKGTPALFVTGSDVEMLFTEISPLLVTEKYAEAVKRVLTVFAEKLPEFAIDRTNSLTKEETTAINDILSAGWGDNGGLAMIFINSSGKKTIEEYAKEQFDKCFALSSGGNAVMAVNVRNAEYFIYGTASVVAEKDQSKIKEDMESCLTSADEKKSFNYQKAAEIFGDFISK